MAVAKFNWHGTNPSKSFRNRYPPKSYFKEMCKLNATKAETEAAYNALVNHGECRDFKVKVWNDICAKAYDLCQEWGIHGDEIKEEAWSPFMHIDDREAWIKIAMETWDCQRYQAEEWTDAHLYPMWEPGVLRAQYYNVLYGTWLLPVGLKEHVVHRGEPIKGEYILKLVDIINHWTELHPMNIRLRFSAGGEQSAVSVVLPFLSIEPDPHSMVFTLRDGIIADESIQMGMILELGSLAEPLRIAQLLSLPFASTLNFMKMNIQCRIWDKVPNCMAFTLEMQYRNAVSPVLLGAIPVIGDSKSIFRSLCRGDTALALDGFRVFWNAQSALRVKPNTAASFPFSFRADLGAYHGTGKVRTRRPLPFAVQTGFHWNGRAMVEHQGTLLAEMADDTISIIGRAQLAGSETAVLTQNGSIGILGLRAEPLIPDAVVLKPEDADICYHAPDIDGDVADAVIAAHFGQMGLHSTETLHKPPSNTVSHSGFLPGIHGNAEMSFSNEQTFVMRDGSFSTREDDIQLDFQSTAVFDLEEKYGTTERISLSESPPLELCSAEGSASTTENALLDMNVSIEAAADSIIRSLSSGEVFFGLNAELNVDIIAAGITSAAAMEAKRQSMLGAEVEVSTMERAIADRILRKLLESSVSAGAVSQASLILSTIRFLETGNHVQVYSEADAASRSPKQLRGKTAFITHLAEAFIDASYVRGSSPEAEAIMRTAAEALPEISNSSTYLVAAVLVQLAAETVLDQTPAAVLEGNAVASSGSEAGVVLAHSVLIYASAYEPTLAAAEENTPAADFERKLSF